MSILDNVRVAKKLAIGFGLCLVLYAISALVAISSMQNMNAHMKTITDVANVEAATASKFVGDFRQYRLDQLQIVATGNSAIEDGFKMDVTKRKQAIDQDIENYDKLAVEPTDRANLDVVKTNWQKIVQYQDAMLTAGYGVDETTQTTAGFQKSMANLRVIDKIQNQDLAASYSALADTADAMVDWNAKRTAQLTAQSTAAYLAARTTVIVLLMIALFLCISTATLITTTITGSITTFSGRMADLSNSFTDLAAYLTAFSQSDLTPRQIRTVERLKWNRKDEFGDLGRVFDSMLEQGAQATQATVSAQQSLSQVISRTRTAAIGIAASADELASGNEDLSGRTAEQASSLEETAASMEEMTSVVKQSAQNAQHASEVANQSKGLAIAGGDVVKSAVEAMEGIDHSSKKIAEIVSVIDDIAFQTNLLALNAAVEAARVGEQGRGFAVVAAEVRNLAGRSSTAAKEIKALVQESVQKVEIGATEVNKSGEQLRKIVEAGEQVAQIVSSISSGAQEQSAGIEQVNKAVIQMDEITQKNAALVEEATAASAEMSHRAHELSDLVKQFKIEDSQADALQLGAHRAERSTGTHGAPARPRRAATKPALRVVETSIVHDDMEEF
ncbi:MAG: methyl-accepting chemotaxis protein [Capsulimonadaceae bacterium]|nr:methyl-accepting chemotaxis protein [Capsulimonadaceae bacterium]